MEDWSQGWPAEQHVKITAPVHVKQSRGAGTVLAIAFFWPALMTWWTILLAAWIVWMVIAGLVSISDHEFFARNWYQPWPAWMLGIR
jgi:hypothetical protein